MAVSLTRLITILALAFGVSADAADPFEVTIIGSTLVYYLSDPHGNPDADQDPNLPDPQAYIEVPLTIKTDVAVAALRLDTDLANGITAGSIGVYAMDKEGSQIMSGATIVQNPGTGKEKRVTIRIQPRETGNNTAPIVAKVVVQVGALTASDITLRDDKNAVLKSKNSVTTHTITVRPFFKADPDRPNVVSIQRLRPSSQTVVSAFEEAVVTGPFNIRIVFTEKPHDFKLAHINVEGGTASHLVVGQPFARQGGTHANQTIRPHPIEGRYAHSGDPAYGLAHIPPGLDRVTVPLPTGDDAMYHQYRVTITPHRYVDRVKISINMFHDNDSPYHNYYQPIDVDQKPDGREQLSLKVNVPKFDLQAGYPVYLPHREGAKIPYLNSTPGHYILTRNKAGSGIKYAAEKENRTDPGFQNGVENDAKTQTAAQLLYNVRESTDVPNLETFLVNGGTIHLVSYDPKYKKGDAYISEVMWGTDASQDPVSNSNWIEIRNGKTEAIRIDNRLWALWFYEYHETPPTAYLTGSTYEGPKGQTGEIIDVIGTKASGTGLRWSIVGKGRSGRRTPNIPRTQALVFSLTTPLHSMYRLMDARDATKPADGTVAGNWMETKSPSVNVAIGRENVIVATPGAAENPIIPAEHTPAEAKKTANTGTIPQDGSIYISEIMFAGGGTLPQWIEIANGSRTEIVDLSGWTITVNNVATDASVRTPIKLTISEGTTVHPRGQHETPATLLVITEQGRNNIDAGAKGRGQILNLWAENRRELMAAGVTKPGYAARYPLLSETGFLITLAPPYTAHTTAGDSAGNLSADGAAAWALPMRDGNARSSIIRRHIPVFAGPTAPEDGTLKASWSLAADTAFRRFTYDLADSYYGAADDVGTPGFRAGSALPVELSSFRPARQKETGAVVIAWATQSELNNAGFFIKRAQQRDGEFKVIHATMIPGAGTTGEKRSYTYTDTTAQPNLVYYYQIEDVSLDGNRQTLTRGIRLKGHIGAAGKATTLWGKLKSSNE